MHEDIINRNSKYFLCLLFLLASIFLYAEPSESEIVWRTPNQSKIEKLKEEKQFQYSRKIVEPQKKMNNSWIPNFRLNLFSLRNIMAGIFIIGILVGFIYLMFHLRAPAAMDMEEKDPELAIVKQEDFDNEIAKNILASNYRKAIRLLYYKNLRALADQLIIKMEKGKTNHAYIYEINDGTMRNDFIETTRIFDYVWYGEFSLSNQGFEQARLRFDNLNKLIVHAKS